MSQEDVEAFERAIDAFNRRDIEAVLKELDPEVEWPSASRNAVLWPLRDPAGAWGRRRPRNRVDHQRCLP